MKKSNDPPSTWKVASYLPPERRVKEERRKDGERAAQGDRRKGDERTPQVLLRA